MNPRVNRPAPWPLLVALAASATLGLWRMHQDLDTRHRSRALDVLSTWRPAGPGTRSFGSVMRRGGRQGARFEAGEVEWLAGAVVVTARGPSEGDARFRVDLDTRAVEPLDDEARRWVERLRTPDTRP